MTIELVLYASITKLVPGSIAGNPISVEASDKTTVGDLLSQAGIPDDMRLILLVNGLSGSRDQELKDRDRLAVFPPIAGG
ncbi:MAG: MoaD/ThiS family protein [Pseudomonadota bacterium]